MNRRVRLEVVHIEDPSVPKADDPCYLSVVRIVHFSDTHDRHDDPTTGIPPLPHGDILIHTGDFTNFGKRTEIVAFNNYLGLQTHPYKIVVIGNHDVRRKTDQLTDLDIKALLTNATHVPLYETVTVLGVRFYGMPWQRMFNWAYVERRPAHPEGVSFVSRLHEIPDNGFDVLLTHGPIFEQGDLWEQNPSHPDPRKRSGSDIMADRLAELTNPPVAHFFGHIHEDYGMSRNAAGTLFVNGACSAHADPLYKSEWTPWRVFELRVRMVEDEEEEGEAGEE